MTLERDYWREPRSNRRSRRALTAIPTLTLLIGAGVMRAQTGGTVTKPTAWRGDDIRVAIRRLVISGASDEKGEFQTLAQFEAAQASALKANGSRTLLFVKPPSILDPDFEYDADSAKMTVYTRGHREKFSESFCVELAHDDISRRHYVAKNAFGVSILVTEIVANEFGIVPSDGSLTFDGSSTLEFPMEMTEAKRSKPFLRIAAVGHISEGRLYRDTEYSSPTVTDPYDTTTRKAYLPFRLEEIRVIDIRSGKVWATTKDATTAAKSQSDASDGSVEITCTIAEIHAHNQRHPDQAPWSDDIRVREFGGPEKVKDRSACKL